MNHRCPLEKRKITQEEEEDGIDDVAQLGCDEPEIQVMVVIKAYIRERGNDMAPFHFFSCYDCALM